MKALSVAQPWAALIMSGRKRIENRTWPTNYRGPLVIHAGKTKDRLKDGLPESGVFYPDELEFGKLLGVVELVDCVRFEDFTPGMFADESPHPREDFARVDQLYAEGPWCWILRRPRLFKEPVAFRGALGLFLVPDKLLEADQGAPA